MAASNQELPLYQQAKIIAANLKSLFKKIENPAEMVYKI